MRLVKHLLVLLLFCFICASCDRSKISGISEWTTFSPAGERFSVLMPTEPTSTTVMGEGQVPVHFFTARPSKDYGFVVSHNSFPQNADLTKVFDNMKAYIIINNGGQLISDKDIALHGIPGRQFVYEKEDRVVSLRSYLIDREVYQVFCVMPKESVDQKIVNEFLDSFQLK